MAFLWFLFGSSIASLQLYSIVWDSHKVPSSFKGRIPRIWVSGKVSRRELEIGDIVTAIFVTYNLPHRDIAVYWGVTVPALRKLRLWWKRQTHMFFKSGKFHDGRGEKSISLRRNYLLLHSEFSRLKQQSIVFSQFQWISNSGVS